MAENQGEQKITIDDVEYPVADLSESAKAQIVNIQFVDNKLQQLRNELAVSDTARIGYSAALKREIQKTNDTDKS